VGPFEAHAVPLESRPPSSLVVEVSVRNAGSKTARANCRVVALVGSFVESGDNVLTREIGGGETIRFRHVLGGVNAPQTNVAVTCT
jgi:hypothetical protein